MKKDDFSYQGERLHQARSALMLPHLRGEAASIAGAFEHCYHAFAEFDENRVKDPDARQWIDTIKRSKDTTGLKDTSGKGLWQVKAEQMTEEEKIDFSGAVDDLASFFDRAFWTAHADVLDKTP